MIVETIFFHLQIILLEVCETHKFTIKSIVNERFMIE